ncbi:hypothetical protein EJB05_54016, partial [Eragrostis curvula]
MEYINECTRPNEYPCNGVARTLKDLTTARAAQVSGLSTAIQRKKNASQSSHSKHSLRISLGMLVLAVALLFTLMVIHKRRMQEFFKKNGGSILQKNAYELENSGRAMFDKDIAVTEEDVLVLEEIGFLAIECLKEKVQDRPDMKEVAERLVMLRRARKHGRWNYRSPRHYEEISTEGPHRSFVTDISGTSSTTASAPSTPVSKELPRRSPKIVKGAISWPGYKFTHECSRKKIIHTKTLTIFSKITESSKVGDQWIVHRPYHSLDAARVLESEPPVPEVELPQVLLLQDVANDGHPGPRALLHADALHPGRRVDHVALRRRLQPRRPSELHLQLRYLRLAAAAAGRPVVAVLERVHADLRHAGESFAQRRDHGLVRRRGEDGEAGPGVEDGAAVLVDVPHVAGDVELHAVHVDAIHRHGVERAHPAVEQQPRLGRRRGAGGGAGRGVLGPARAEGEVAGGVARGEVVHEAVGEAAAEAGRGPGREGDVAVAQAEHAVRGLEALPVVGGGAAQHHVLQLRTPAAVDRAAVAAGQRDRRRVGAHRAARRRAVLVPDDHTTVR